MGYVNVYGVEPSIDAFNKANKIIKKNISNEMFGSKTFADKKIKDIYRINFFRGGIHFFRGGEGQKCGRKKSAVLH